MKEHFILNGDDITYHSNSERMSESILVFSKEFGQRNILVIRHWSLVISQNTNDE